VSTVVLRVEVEVTVTDPRVYERVTGPEGDQFRATCYDLRTEQDVDAHLAKACLDGYDDASQLDGWADLPRGAAEMRAHSAEVDR
jgi:hypothetical protein